MQVRQRGGKEATLALASAAKAASIKKGFVHEQAESATRPLEGGAFASMQNRQRVAPAQQSLPQDIINAFSTSTPATVSQPPVLNETAVKPGMLYSRIYESIETVGQTKEYFNATSSLFTLYALGQLNESVLRTLSSEDLREVKGIVREFKGILDSY